MDIFDAHCHLEAAKYCNSRKLAVAAVKSTDIAELVSYRNQNILAKIGYGTHPWFVESLPSYEQFQFDIQQFSPDFIGECGLDFLKPNHDLQLEVCHMYCKLALEFNLPIVFHCVRAYNELLHVIKQYPSLRGIIHAFNGNTEIAKQFNKKGFMLGIGSVLLNENSQLFKSVINFDESTLIFESDSPYMPIHGEELSTPDNCLVYADKFSGLKNSRIEDVVNMSNSNWMRLFG